MVSLRALETTEHLREAPHPSRSSRGGTKSTETAILGGLTMQKVKEDTYYKVLHMTQNVIKCS